jgi:FlaA1/EpsC-like NDP-sugar epimerase
MPDAFQVAVGSACPDGVDGATSSGSASLVDRRRMPAPGSSDHGRCRHHPPTHRPHTFGVEELLDRPLITTELDSTRRWLACHRVLITGAGGSIGSEIARQVDALQPETVILLDRDETHLHDAAALLTGAHQLVLADICDADAVFEIFERHRPTVVFHAAAHKHVPILEAHPIEAARTNVFGTLHLVEAASAYRVPHFVMISTDKAVRPTSVMGASKLIGERILQAQEPPYTTFCAVRFGNVLGSRGSVIPTFSRQIASGGPVTVTDPLMTRFFMTTEEAVQLVLQAPPLADAGDIFLLDMGEPVSILELAQRMISLSGYAVGSEIEITFVGGRPGERLSEELCSADETCAATSHRSIRRVLPPAIEEDLLAKGLLALEDAVALRDADEVRAQLFALAGPDLLLHDSVPAPASV